MTVTLKVAPVRKSIRVSASPEVAFQIFTGSMGSWWPKHHSINRSPIREVVIEPAQGGRWFETGEDGSECQWGRVVAWEPPSRLVLSWQIDRNFQFDPDLMTEVEVRFSPDGDGTLVQLEHRLDGYGEAAAHMFDIFDGSNAWQATLEEFAKAAV